MPVKSWKTTVSGILAIVMGGWGIAQPFISGQVPASGEMQGSVAAILAGIGLILAKDSDVTGGTRQK